MFFFFKQKTAYEVRISDWSSDVCSSDLQGQSEPTRYGSERPWRPPASAPWRRPRFAGRFHYTSGSSFTSDPLAPPILSHRSIAVSIQYGCGRSFPPRSEEHSSEHQSLMRTSYAVFCLKHNNNDNTNTSLK